MSNKNKLNLAANRNTEGRLLDADSDSDSDYYVEEEKDNSNNNAKPDEDCPWQSAVDPNSGKTYYYHIHTRETQWSKPAEMGSREERAALAAKEKQQKDFFAAMEANILNSISQGFKVPEKRNRLDLEFEQTEISEDPLDVSSGVVSSASSHSRSPRRRGSGKTSSADFSRPNLVRTISSMDTSLLSDLIKRVPSSRHITRVPSQKGVGGRQQSSMSLSRGSSHRSVGRKGRIMRGVGERMGSAVAVPSTVKQANSKASDDDELPPLTVVTTPDLRRRDGTTKEYSNSNFRDALSRNNSLTLDQLTGGAGGLGDGASLSDSNFFDNAANGSRFAFDNSFSLDGSMGDHSGGMLSHLDSSHNRSLGGLEGSNHSLDASDKSFGGGGSAGHISVSSNLLPVEEGMDENFDSSPCLKVDANIDNVLEDGQEENDQSFSFGMEASGDFGQGETTANWLDALPADETAADREDIVGYGNNAKPFKDAGFTSFFDESMANFDLSDKETQQLQKLALISEQMTKVLESEEGSEESEEECSSSESSDDLGDRDDLNQSANVEYELNLGGDVEYQLNFGGNSGEDDESLGVPMTPSFHTPKTASTTKTTESASTGASTTKSPILKPSKPPPRRTLGAKTANVPRALKSIEPLDGDKEIVLSPQLRIGGMALTIDNAGGHFAGPVSITADNARSRFTGTKVGTATGNQKAVRRNIGEKSGLERIKRPSLIDGVGDMNSSNGSLKSTKSTKSTNSTSSKNIHAAARRLSMFSLKHVDRSKLRHVGDATSPKLSINSSAKGKGPAKGVDARPELVRRNTCGTIYVGATMSAPDKDATIKCVCGVYRAHILQSELSGVIPNGNNFQIFNDLETQQKQSAKCRGYENKPSAAKVSVPSLDQITTFYRDVFKRAQMEYDCIIISLIYVERLIKITRGELRPCAMNWRSILFSSMVLASKVWDDLSMWNADFSQTCPNGVRFSLKRINELEVAVLSALSYKVKVPASEYAKYYFLLRSMLIKSGLIGEDADTTTPLDLEGAKRLQQVSTQFQSDMGATKKEMKKAKYMRSKSMGMNGAWKANAASRKDRATNSKVGLEHVVQM